MALLLLYLSVALLFSFICSILEAVLLSATPAYIKIKKEQNRPWAILLETYKDNIDRPLAAILTLNTFAHTIGAAGVGAQAQVIWGDKYLSLISALLTIIILVFSEIIPKTIGANYWKSLLAITVRILRVLIVILFPFVVLSQYITRTLSRKGKQNVLTRSDFGAMTEIGYEEGIFKKREIGIIRNLLHFNKIKIREIMTPRTVIQAFEEDLSVKDFFKESDLNFSRIPLFRDNIDHISGYVLKDELLIKSSNKEEHVRLSELTRPITSVFEGAPVFELFHTLMEKSEHIALVTDEYGGTSGIVTMEDVIETLMGMEITDESDRFEDMQKVALKKWKERND